MSEINIFLVDIADALEFVNVVERYPYTMDLCCGSVVVDAKSILGVMYLGFNHVVNLRVYADDCGSLRQDIEKYVAA